MFKWSEKPFSLWAQIFLGLFLSALSYRLFLIPNDIAAGGFTGIGQLVNSVTGWPVGAVSLALNVPLFLFSMRSLGLSFGIKSLLATVLLSLLIDTLPVGALTNDAMLASVFGGLLAGMGFGLILRGGATTGGSEMLGKLVTKRIPVVTVGAITFMVDALVIVVSGFAFDPTKAMLALIAAFLMNRVLDAVLEGLNTAKAYYIISSHSEQIAQSVMRDMDRGVTGLLGRGMYSGDERLVLMCVVGRMETLQLRRIVKQIDPSAFMIVTKVHEALGEGFKSQG